MRKRHEKDKNMHIIVFATELSVASLFDVTNFPVLHILKNITASLSFRDSGREMDEKPELAQRDVSPVFRIPLQY